MARFLTGQKAITAATQQIYTGTVREFSQYKIKAPAGNTANVELGDSTLVAGAGYILEPGQELFFDSNVQNTDAFTDVSFGDWWAVGTVGDKLTWVALKR